LRLLGEIARRHGRKLVVLGRSVATHARVARETARTTGEGRGAPYLDWPSDLVWPESRARELPRRALLGVATGSQGEEAAALGRLARGEHPALQLGAGDVVVLSSRVIPGNESSVMRVIGDLLRGGVDVRTWWSDRSVHVSGHAHREEQRRMIELVRPRGFVPVHGTLHHLSRHASLARELGVPEVCVLENGDVAAFDPLALEKAGRVHAGRVHVYAHRVIPPNVLHERSALASRGAAHVVVLVDDRGRLAGDVALATRGVLDETLDAHLIAAAQKEAALAVDELEDGASGGSVEDASIAEAARQAVRRAFGRILGFKPLTTSTVVRVGR
jgi:ribonuclease J